MKKLQIGSVLDCKYYDIFGVKAKNAFRVEVLNVKDNGIHVCKIIDKLSESTTLEIDFFKENGCLK